MSWVRLDDQMAFHAKIVAAGNDAVGAWVRMLALSCAQLTDGRVTRAVALTIAKPKTLAALVSARLLEETEGGDYVIHDFHQWNPTADEVREKREADRQQRIAAGRAGGVKSGETRRSASTKRERSENEAGRFDSASTLTKRNEALSSPLLSSPLPIEKEIEDQQPSQTRIRRVSAKDTRLDPDWQPREQEIEYGARKGVDAAAMRDRFVNHYVSAPKDKGLARDWNHKFRTWIDNGISFGDAPKLQTRRALPPRAELPPVEIPADAPEPSDDTADLFAGIGNFGGAAR